MSEKQHNDNEHKYKIYVYKNKMNGKMYVGQTCRTLEERAGKNGYGYNCCPIFSKAIKKYGWDNFESKILYDNLSHQDANRLEKLFIQLLKTQNDLYGYNLNDGGNGGNNYKTTPVIQYDLDGNYISSYKTQVDAAQSIGCSLRGIRESCSNHGIIYGYMVRYANEKPPDPYVTKTQKEILQFSKDGKYISSYLSIKRASDSTNIQINKIYSALSSHSKTHLCDNYVWLYKKDYELYGEEYLKKIIKNQLSMHGEKRVLKLDKNGTILEEFNSIKDASISVNKSHASVSGACRGNTKTCAGFYWKFK